MTKKKTGRSKTTVAKNARRAVRVAKKQGRSTDELMGELLGQLPPGWHTMDDFDSMPDAAFANPFDGIDPEREKSLCPLDDHCAGCGARERLHVMLSAFSGGEIACATVCARCDNTSMMHLREIGPARINARVAAHAEHRNQLVSDAN